MPPPDTKEALANALISAVCQDGARSERPTMLLIRDLLQTVHEAIGKALDEANSVLQSQQVDPSDLRAVPLSAPIAGPSRVRRIASKATIDSADEADAEEVFGDVEEVGAVAPDAIEDDDNVGGAGEDVGEGDGDDIVDAEGDVEIEE